MALGENPKRVYESQRKSPTTRMANAAVMRQALYKAKKYVEKKKDKKGKPDFDLGMENLAKVITKKMPARIHCHRADDIVTAIRVANEFKIKIVLEHATDGHKVADVIAKNKIPVCIGPTLTGRVKEELKDRTVETIRVLHEKGVLVSIITDHPVLPLHMLGLCAGYALKTGLEEEEILKMITINPAKLMGISDKVGSIEKGKDADIIVWKGNPLYPDAHVKYSFVNGELIYENEKI
jgi:imidazolonepropionase-like amidohydrolase